MVVKGDVVNVGNLRSDVQVHVKAKADAAGTSGKIDNKGVINLNNGITFASNDDGDGILHNEYHIDPGKGEVNFGNATTSFQNVQIKKTFTKEKNYYISFPFRVKVGDITAEGTAPTGYTIDQYKPGRLSGSRYTWIYKYDSQIRADHGINSTDATMNAWQYIGKNNAECDAYVLEPGIGYNLIIKYDPDVEEVGDHNVTLTFPAMNSTTLADIYTVTDNEDTNGTKSLPLIFRNSTTKSKAQWGWNFLGVHRTSNYHMDPAHLTIDGIHQYIDTDGILQIYAWNNARWESFEITDERNPVYLSPFVAYYVQIGGDYAEEITKDQAGTLSTSKNGLRMESTNSLRSSTSQTLNRLHLKLEDGKGSDELRVIQSDRYSNKYVLGEDAPKVFYDDVPELYSIVEDVPMTIDRILTTDNDVALGVNLKKADSYTVGISRLEGFDDTDIYLIDKVAGISHNLLDGDYTFQANTGTIDDRFALHFGSVTAIQTPGSQISVFVDNNVAHVKNIKVGDTVSIYNVGGQLISQGVASSSEQSYRLAGTGIYVVKVSGSESFISKVINK
ncbi:hypothetical protein FACS189423_10250 [Bacteroidia bacterium]|nr:hypothetical protein FACS189423_10250 [Bacteroidia bacterium]